VLAGPLTSRTAPRFPPPWTLDEQNDICFIVRDANGQALAYVYFEGSRGGGRQPPPSFDHLIGLHQQRGRYLDPESLGYL
jgi:hypothetical protein